MIPLILAAAAAFGTDPTPAGKAAVRDMIDLSTNFCAAIYRGDKNLTIDAILKPRGFTAPGEREDTESGPYKLTDIRWWKPDRSMMLVAKLIDGQMNECIVYVPRTVWNQFDAEMPAYAKGTGLALAVSKDSPKVYYGGGYKASVNGSGSSANGGTSLSLERYND